MSTIDFLQIAAILAGFLILAFVFSSRFAEIKAKLEQSKNDPGMQMLNQNMINISERLDKTSDSLNLRLDKAAQIIGAVSRELGTMSEIGRGLKDFQSLLSSPKLRGNLGETVLYDTMAQALPNSLYETQYKFKDGQTVDAIIRTSSGMICVDSKFPMENFIAMAKEEDAGARDRLRKDLIRDVKKHIDDVSKKYIIPIEGTVDFAILYVPSEKVYYEIALDCDELILYAKDKKILLVSPNTFIYHLYVIRSHAEQAKMNEQAGKILEILKEVYSSGVKFNDNLLLVSRHLTNAKGAMDTTQSEYTKFISKVDQVKLLE